MSERRDQDVSDQRQESSGDFPSTGRLASIDYGTQRVGVAICDAERRLASPLLIYQRRSPAADAAAFRKLVAEEQIVGFVVGLPVHMSGDESGKSAEARQFGQWLGEATGLPVCFHDERMSTVAAEQMLVAGGLTSKQRRARRDMLAAQVILASFLEARHRGDTGQPLHD